MPQPSVPRWLPNAISFVRVALVPVWLLLAEAANVAHELAEPARGDELRLMAALVFVAIGVSDVLDGWLARRFSLQSPLGATVDAVADKLAQVALTTYLALRHGPAFPPIPLWFLLLLIARDALLLTGFAVARLRGGRVDNAHEWHGKGASLCLFAALTLACFAAPTDVLDVVLWTTAALVVWSTAAYAVRGARQLRAT